MPNNELLRKSSLLKEKLEKKKLESRKISPEEQAAIDKWDEGKEERERKAKEAEEKRSLELKREKEKAEFMETCEKKLKPIFKKIQALVFTNQESKLSSNYKGKGIPGDTYNIWLSWDYWEDIDYNDAGPIADSGWRSIISLSVILDSENKYVISTLSNLEPSKPTKRGFLINFFLGLNASDKLTPNIIKKVTLDDPDWKEQLEDYVLEELKQKRAI